MFPASGEQVGIWEEEQTVSAYLIVYGMEKAHHAFYFFDAKILCTNQKWKKAVRRCNINFIPITEDTNECHQLILFVELQEQCQLLLVLLGI